MSRKQLITVIAIAFLVATLPLAWSIADVRATQAADRERVDLADDVSTRQAPNDYDGDGVPDDVDRCPRTPETRNGHQDGDGCPDVVETTGAS